MTVINENNLWENSLCISQKKREQMCRHIFSETKKNTIRNYFGLYYIVKKAYID